MITVIYQRQQQFTSHSPTECKYIVNGLVVSVQWCLLMFLNELNIVACDNDLSSHEVIMTGSVRGCKLEWLVCFTLFHTK